MTLVILTHVKIRGLFQNKDSSYGDTYLLNIGPGNLLLPDSTKPLPEKTCDIWQVSFGDIHSRAFS